MRSFQRLQPGVQAPLERPERLAQGGGLAGGRRDVLPIVRYRRGVRIQMRPVGRFDLRFQHPFGQALDVGRRRHARRLAGEEGGKALRLGGDQIAERRDEHDRQEPEQQEQPPAAPTAGRRPCFRRPGGFRGRAAVRDRLDVYRLRLVSRSIRHRRPSPAMPGASRIRSTSAIIAS